MQIIFKLHSSMTGSVASERKRKICVGWGRGKWRQIVFYTRAPTILTIPLVPAIVIVSDSYNITNDTLQNYYF